MHTLINYTRSERGDNGDHREHKFNSIGLIIDFWQIIDFGITHWHFFDAWGAPYDIFNCLFVGVGCAITVHMKGAQFHTTYKFTAIEDMKLLMQDVTQILYWASLFKTVVLVE